MFKNILTYYYYEQICSGSDILLQFILSYYSHSKATCGFHASKKKC